MKTTLSYHKIYKRLIFDERHKTIIPFQRAHSGRCAGKDKIAGFECEKA